MHASMSASLLAQKEAARKAMRVSLQALSADTLQSASLAVTQKLIASALFRSSRRVGVYVSCQRLREVDTSQLLEALLRPASEKQCYVPLVGTGAREMRLLRIDSLVDLKPNKMGILEPSLETSSGFPRDDAMLGSEPLDLIIVPGVAFDAHGRRLGRGGGYYDALFAADVQRAGRINTRPAKRVALAFDEQVMEEVPADDGQDLNVDCIVTPSRILGPHALL